MQTHIPEIEHELLIRIPYKDRAIVMDEVSVHHIHNGVHTHVSSSDSIIITQATKIIIEHSY